MKRAFVIHGWEGTPEGSWWPWLKKLGAESIINNYAQNEAF